MPENEAGADQASTRKSIVAPPPAPEAGKATAKPGDEQGTPEQHAYATENGPAKYKGPRETAPTVLTFNGREERARFSVAHECAAILHGWHEHEHHADAPIVIARKDYELALKAALEPWHAPTCPKRGHVLGSDDPVKHAAILAAHGSPVPHEPALSPYAHAPHKAAVEVAKAAQELAK